MVLTKKMIRDLREHAFMEITAKQERELLRLLGGKEVWGEYCFTEQDIYEQTRIYLRDNPDTEAAERGSRWRIF
jgi:hypothetical protein